MPDASDEELMLAYAGGDAGAFVDHFEARAVGSSRGTHEHRPAAR